MRAKPALTEATGALTLKPTFKIALQAYPLRLIPKTGAPLGKLKSSTGVKRENGDDRSWYC
jgi:hypothetical protein